MFSKVVFSKEGLQTCPSTGPPAITTPSEMTSQYPPCQPCPLAEEKYMVCAPAASPPDGRLRQSFGSELVGARSIVNSELSA